MKPIFLLPCFLLTLGAANAATTNQYNNYRPRTAMYNEYTANQYTQRQTPHQYQRPQYTDSSVQTGAPYISPVRQTYQSTKVTQSESDKKNTITPYISLKLGYAANKSIINFKDSNAKDIYINFEDDQDSQQMITNILNWVDKTADNAGLFFNISNTFSINPAIGVEFDIPSVKHFRFRLEGEYTSPQTAKTDYIDVSELINYTDDTNCIDDECVPFPEAGGKLESTFNAFMLNGYIDIKTQSPFTPYFSMGVGYSTLETKFDINVAMNLGVPALNGAGITIEDNSIAWSLGCGLAYKITDTIYIDAQYRYINWGKLGVGDTINSILGTVGVSEFISFPNDIALINSKSHQFLLGARVTF